MRMAFFNRKGFWEALTITVAVTAVLLFATWQLASKPGGASADELRSNVVFLSSELDALKQRLDRSQAREAVLSSSAR